MSRGDKISIVGVILGVLGIIPAYLAFFAPGRNEAPSAIASATTEGQEPDQLFSFIGEDLAIDCDDGDAAGLFTDELVAIDCIPPGDITFSLALYEDARAATKDYRYSISPDKSLGTEDSRKGCQMGKPSEGRWYYGDNDTGQLAGHLNCLIFEGEAWLEWTHTKQKIYGIASREDSNIKALYSWWEKNWSKKR